MSAPTVVRHGARFHPAIVDVFASYVGGGDDVHDPMAGTGERLGALADRIGFTFTGTELEASFIVDPRVCVGNATNPTTYPLRDRHVIVTSPPYPNGCADHFAAHDASKRQTYRAWTAANEGADRPLHVDNLGRYGYRGRGEASRARATYWRLADDVVRCWRAGWALVNVKDFKYAGGEVEPVVARWADVLVRRGFEVVESVDVVTPGLRHGSNRDERTEHEVVLVVRRVAS